MKTMFASLLVFLQCAHIKNTISIFTDINDIFGKISINIDTKKVLIFPSPRFSFEWVYFRAGKPWGCSSIYVEKIVKYHLWEDMTISRERVSDHKNQYELFCKKWGFEYFLYNNFKKKQKKKPIL